jgi:hypothetical protein
MNTEIEFLSILEADLDEAARRTKARETGRSRSMAPPRRKLGSSWVSAAALIVAFLVIAGGIGFLAQGGMGGSKDATSAAGGPVGPRSFASGTPGPLPRSAPIYGPLPPALHGNAAKRTDLSGGSGGGSYTGLVDPQAVTGTDLSKIVRDGSISLEIPDKTFGQSEIAVTKVARDAHGFVLSSSTQSERSGTFTLRVPARHFDAAMAALRPIGTVESSQQTGKDVTAQYVDLTARLRILSGRRAVILKLMSRATSIGETLDLQNQFDNVQLQIEQIQGNLNVLRNQVAESMITVDLHEKDSPKPASAVTAPSLAKSLHLAWQGFLRVIGGVVVGLGYMLPVAVVGLAIWFATRAMRRRRATSAAA